ncbi:hypothetical protein BHE74_00049690 [Ensete ventricosum]|nr:hypothetical protein BHE74_00049690 [Ensete ventricosum]
MICGNPIDVTDPRWEIFLVVKKVQDPLGDCIIDVLGFATVYRFFRYPDSTRLRIGQILVLPPYQGQGHGCHLLESVYSVAVSENIYDVTAEEPSDYLQYLRACIDTKRLLCFQPIKPAINSVVSCLKEGNLSKRICRSSSCPPASVMEIARQKLKINKKQFLRCWEVLIYLNLNQEYSKCTENFRAWVSDRVKSDIVDKDAVDSRKHLVEVPNDYDHDMTFVVCWSQNGGESDGIDGNLGGNQSTQDEQLNELVKKRLEDIVKITNKGAMTIGMRCFNSKKMALLCLFFFFVAAVQVRAQTTGFINIDCGIPENSSYFDGLTYVSDAQFTDTGVNRNVSPAYSSVLARRFLTVRSFPDGARNCYTFKSIIPGLKYLIRATFLYGNYDLKSSPSVQFDLYLGVNLWKTINVTDPSDNFLTEAITEATADLISVCLLNTGRGTPFISGLDLRPMAASLYPLVNASRSLVLLDRFNMAPTVYSFLGGVDRYALDSYDRIWFQYKSKPSWDEISTNSTVETVGNDQFEVPSQVMQTAVVPANSTTTLELSFSPDPGDLDEFYAVVYFAELQQNASRQFFVYLNGALLNDAKPFTPDFLVSDAIYNINPSTGYGELNISLVATDSSTLPPLLNAVEVFSTMRNTNVASDGGDGKPVSSSSLFMVSARMCCVLVVISLTHVFFALLPRRLHQSMP